MHNALEAIAAKMRAIRMPREAIDDFISAYTRFTSGEHTLIPETDIAPLENIDHIDSLSPDGGEALAHTAVLRLNGGLGTTMGLTTAKSLLVVRNNLRFIDIILAQLAAQRAAWNVQLPLILFNSPATAQQTVAEVTLPPNPDNIPSSIQQGLVPRIWADTHEPVTWPCNPHEEWAPPGHGDVYSVLARTGMIQRLLEAGYRYIFVANADNLGAIPEAHIAAWFAQSGTHFAAEVVRRTPMDRKGGHFAIDKATGKRLLREVAQTPSNDLPYFHDISRHPYLNTNNLWINLESLASATSAGIHLPLIVNEKRIAGDENRAVIQLESAMGAAISTFPTADLLEVSRERFIPVKSTSDLLLLRSDAFTLTPSYRLVDAAHKRPLVVLDPAYFRTYDEYMRRIPETPSLASATEFIVEGDVILPPGLHVSGRARYDTTGLHTL
ncbi:UTP--glucose-1-phosphate uridylyltransferase [Arcanobacterium haemolyticum]|nr:UTP--glucose-1-phosphate uridylyltransferase [Arcanobacterium haemolyticum]